jgi:hypothetical protein
MFTAIVKEIASGLLGERVYEQSALRAAGNDHTPDGLEILSCVLFVPARASWRDGLQPHRRASYVAGDAPRVAGALGKKNGLHTRLEKLVIKGWFLRHDPRGHQE